MSLYLSASIYTNTVLAEQTQARIAQDKSASSKLKNQVATLQNELAGMAKAKAEADKLRAEENAACACLI